MLSASEIIAIYCSVPCFLSHSSSKPTIRMTDGTTLPLWPVKKVDYSLQRGASNLLSYNHSDKHVLTLYDTQKHDLNLPKETSDFADCIHDELVATK